MITDEIKEIIRKKIKNFGKNPPKTVFCRSKEDFFNYDDFFSSAEDALLWAIYDHLDVEEDFDSEIDRIFDNSDNLYLNIKFWDHEKKTRYSVRITERGKNFDSIDCRKLESKYLIALAGGDLKFN